MSVLGLMRKKKSSPFIFPLQPSSSAFHLPAHFQFWSEPVLDIEGADIYLHPLGGGMDTLLSGPDTEKGREQTELPLSDLQWLEQQEDPNLRVKGDRKNKDVPRAGQKSQVPFPFWNTWKLISPSWIHERYSGTVTSFEHSKEESAIHLVTRRLCVLWCSLGGGFWEVVAEHLRWGELVWNYYLVGR